MEVAFPPSPCRFQGQNLGYQAWWQVFLETLHQPYIHFFKKGLFLCVQVFCLQVYVFATCVTGAQGSQNRVLEFLELEFWMVEIHHVGAGNCIPC